MMEILGEIDGWTITKVTTNGEQKLFFSHGDHDLIFDIESPNKWMDKIDRYIDQKLLEIAESSLEYMES